MISVSLLLFVAFVSAPAAGASPTAFAAQSPIITVDHNTRVPIVLGVMSRCPDALLCESVFDGALTETWDIVDINLSFVGK